MACLTPQHLPLNKSHNIRSEMGVFVSCWMDHGTECSFSSPVAALMVGHDRTISKAQEHPKTVAAELQLAGRASYRLFLVKPPVDLHRLLELEWVL